MCQYPVSSESGLSEQQAEETRAALKALKEQTVITYPGADPGSVGIIRVIERAREISHVRVRKSLGRDLYAGLLKAATAIVGNSSSAIIEAPFLGLPVVKVGSRQMGRERAVNVLDVGYDRKEIEAALRKALFDE